MIRDVTEMETLSKAASALWATDSMASVGLHLGAEYERMAGAAVMMKAITAHTPPQFQIADSLAATYEQYRRDTLQDSLRRIPEQSYLCSAGASLRALSDATALEAVAKERARGLPCFSGLPDYMKSALDVFKEFKLGQLSGTAAEALRGAVSGFHDPIASAAVGIAQRPRTAAHARSYVEAVGGHGFAEALTQGLANVEKDYSKSFFGIADQIRAEALRVRGFNDATLMALAAFSSREKIEAQLSVMGLDPSRFLDTDWAEGVAEEEVSSQQDHPPTIPRSLADARHMVQVFLWHLVISIIAETLVASYGWHPHIDKLNERTARVEQLLNDLPTVLEPIIERAVRRELADHRLSYVVRERAAGLRERPKGGSAALATIFPNQVVTLLGEDGKWIKVEFYDYARQAILEGWVLKKYLQRLPRRQVLDLALDQEAHP